MRKVLRSRIYIDDSNVAACGSTTFREKHGGDLFWGYRLTSMVEVLTSGSDGEPYEVLSLDVFGSAPSEQGVVNKSEYISDRGGNPHFKVRNRKREKGADVGMAVAAVRDAVRMQCFMAEPYEAMLATGDADFLPVVQELKDGGVVVTVAAFTYGLSPELAYAADRLILLDPFLQRITSRHLQANRNRYIRHAQPASEEVRKAMSKIAGA